MKWKVDKGIYICLGSKDVDMWGDSTYDMQTICGMGVPGAVSQYNFWNLYHKNHEFGMFCFELF